MTDPGPSLTLTPSAAWGPVLADLIGQLARNVTDSARRYEAAAREAEGALQERLEALGHAKHAQAAELGPLARAMGVPSEADPGPPVASPPAWGVVLGEAFQAERALERVARELGALTPDPGLRGLAARLAAGAAEQRGEVRELYLRYS